MQLKPSDIELIESTYSTDNSLKPLPSAFILELSTSTLPLTKANVLLAIMELILNYKAYNNRYSPNQKIFWHKSIYSPLLCPFLSQCTVSSLRYMTTLMQIKRAHYDQLISLIKSNVDTINESHNSTITLFLALIKLLKPKHSSRAFSDILVQTSHQLKSRPLRMKIRRMINNRKKPIKPHKPVQTLTSNCTYEEAVGLRHSNEKQRLYPSMVSYKQKEAYLLIDEVIEAFQSQFPNERRQNLIKALITHSMNIAKTYEMLKGRLNEEIGFNSSHDYIIKQMKGTDVYDEIVKEKGEESINERQQFLDIKPPYHLINNYKTKSNK